MVPALNVFTISFKTQFFGRLFSAPKYVPKIGSNTGVGSSQPKNQTQVSHIAGRFFYQLSHKGSPKFL